jgi:alpha-amylase/alpha-mannosidase (GH57 family)
MERYLCIHAHFYQPPRENPWLEEIEAQPSAYPYHDWNERVTAECYSPNAAARIVNNAGQITQLVNNYSRISFNFGPTLLSWLEEKEQDVYRNILAADRLSAARFSGHGSAIAQAYNHIILPLANRRDRETQIKWGIRDFEKRFGRLPEGMWLPETGVDTETLEILADNGIAFTILAPSQAAKVRALRSGSRWKDVSGAQIDPTRAYLARLGQHRQIALFFYDGPRSRAVAFERLLDSGEQFAQRLLTGFSDQRPWPQLMHIATDGESYGHHHPHGDMALAYALKQIEESGAARLTNYGEYLQKHPVEAEVQIVERSAWSCTHGLERWYADCGCNSGMSFRQKWREPLRQALDWLRDTVNTTFAPQMADTFREPWSARDDYIKVVLDRSLPSIENFFALHATRGLSVAEHVVALKLMEMQRHAMLMFTSCGWFFDEISGIEAVKVIEYAGRVLQIAAELAPELDLEARFLKLLERAESNIAEHRNGAEVYRRSVKPAIKSLHDVGAHYAISTLFERKAEIPIFCYTADQKQFQMSEAGAARLATGEVQICSRITLECKTLTFAVLHFGDHNLTAAVRDSQGTDAFRALATDLMSAFSRAELPQVLRLIDRHFAGASYDLRSLFVDERTRIMDRLLNGTLRETESAYRQIYDRHAPLLRFLGSVGLAKPKVLTLTAEFVLNANLERELGRQDLDPQRISMLLEQATAERIALDRQGLGYTLERSLDKKMDALRANPYDHDRLMECMTAAQLAKSIGLPVNLWHAQNVFYEVVSLHTGDQDPVLTALGETLGIDMSQSVMTKPLALTG